MRITETHVYFWGGWLSNFWPCQVELKIYLTAKNYTRVITKSSEHAFMLYKAMYFNDGKAFSQILDAPDGKSAKAIGRKVKNFNANIWDHMSYDKMLLSCRAKFSQNVDLKQKLLDTGSHVIVEASPLDKIWGVGLHFDNDLILDESNWLGENRLGRVLMDVRKELS